ncbi:unnamed protein product [Paramecium sonneborni]|uniref:Uncharacterized protein n=1 Tax=Paramecium sonneborni TaxID=65129 RepID=A0A8S1KSV1_9CILI|nr:unnamed protein product [Paramecium sonneborni]
MYNILQISFIKFLKYRPRFYFADLKKYKYGDEKAYFTKEDEQMLSQLMKKIQQNDDNQLYQQENEKKYPKEELQKILSNHNVTYNEALLRQILMWRKKN